MTHAFFKALLFMAAGSVIAAMAGEQNLDKMGGFRKAMPFTFGCMAIGGLALSGIPPFSGFFSKDEILALVAAREDWHVILAVVGYIGAFLTAVYTWRMIFRAFFGEPVEQARELEHGHLYHAHEPTNPATGEVEDTDVGFPGPDHHIAEREWSMKVAMGLLAVGATVVGVLQIPHVTDVLHNFLEPTFAGLALLRGARAVRRARPGAASSSARCSRSPASRWPTRCGSRTRSGRAPRCARGSPACTRLFVAQVVLRRAHRHADRAAVRMVRPLRAQRVRARRRQRRCSSAARRAPCAPARPRCAPRSPASCATTPRCCCSASPRSASTS